MSDFKFSQNKNPQVLKDTAENNAKKKKGAGRPLQQKEVRSKQVGCYLTEDEFNTLKAKLDGRPASTAIRNLVLDFINE